MQKVVLITGASNGMGYEATKLFAEKGWVVYAGARRLEKIPTGKNIKPIKLDVTDSKSNKKFVNAAIKESGRIDVLINNAGYGEYGPAEEIPMANSRKQFETNYFSAVELAQMVLPTMRAQKSGRIINISSIGGNVYMPLGSQYHATKAALQQWSDVLDVEVQEFGVRSLIIQPGGTKSSWADIAISNAEKNLAKNSPYKKLVSAAKGLFSGSENSPLNGATSLDLARVFYKAATDEKPKLRYFYSLSDRAAVRLAKSHPVIFRSVLNALMKRVNK